MLFRNLPVVFRFRSKPNFGMINRNLCKIVLHYPPKPPTKMNLTIAGANSPMGRTSALLLKQQHIFTRINLYDQNDVSGIADDLNTINTQPEVVPYVGAKNLEEAISCARIVYICGGLQVYPGTSEKDLFEKNVAWVRQIVTYCSEFNPEAMIVIATPPVSFLVPMAVEEFRKNDLDAGKQVFGVVQHYVSRANTICAKHINAIPSALNCFVVGGSHRKTCIPVMSHTPANTLKQEKIDTITRKIQEAEEDALRKNLEDKSTKGCYLSCAYNGAKFTIKLAKALNGEPNMNACAFVQQEKIMEECAKYFSCLVHLDKNGFKSSDIPKLSNSEKNQLRLIINELCNNIFLGSSYITGDDLIIVRKPPKEEKVEEKTVKVEKAKEKKPAPAPCEKITIKQIKVPKKVKKINC